jgi:hypothetical protein
MLGRRVLVGSLAALALGAPARADDVKTVNASSVFTYWQNYLELPAAERTRFRMAYTLMSGGKPVTVPVTLVVDGKRTPLPLKDGVVARMPSLDETKRGKVEIGVPPDTKLTAKLFVEPLARPALRMDAHDLTIAVDQAAKGVKKAAGILAAMAPNLTKVTISGVPGGDVVAADGRTAPLPVEDGKAVFDPAKFPNARWLRFKKVPDHLRFG